MKETGKKSARVVLWQMWKQASGGNQQELKSTEFFQVFQQQPVLGQSLLLKSGFFSWYGNLCHNMGSEQSGPGEGVPAQDLDELEGPFKPKPFCDGGAAAPGTVLGTQVTDPEQ